MKKIFNAVYLLPLLFLSNSCNKYPEVEPQKGSVSITFSNKAGIGGKTAGTSAPSFILFSIQDSNGKEVVKDKSLVLLNFGQGYTTESIELAPGDYKLTQFLVLDSKNNVLYATPKEGSALSQYVNDPLPINFTVNESLVTSLQPQVLAISNTTTPSQFGYASFGFEVVSIPTQTINLKVKLSQPLPEGIPYDSAYITFTNKSQTKKQRLELHTSTASVPSVVASGIINDILPGDWKVSISYFRTLTSNKKSEVVIGFVDLTLKQTTSDLLTSGDGSLAVIADTQITIAKTKTIAWDTYFAFYLRENNKLGAVVTLPANALNPFFEIQMVDASWNYFYIDRIFYETAVGDDVGGFVKGDVAFEKYNDDEKNIDYMDTTSFKQKAAEVKSTSWNTADCVVMRIVDGKDLPIFLYQWDTRISTTGRIVSTDAIPFTRQQIEARKRTIFK
jgi:hypothetical protein